MQVGEILQERYQLKAPLGNNRGRQTWLAVDLATTPSEPEPTADSTQPSPPDQELVVIKLLSFGGEVQWDDLKLFEREAQVLRQLNHPRIPNYRDSFSIDDRVLWFGLVQDYIPGQSFKQLLLDGERFPEEDLRQIAINILTILIYLHELTPPVLHRDIKPSNLILGEDGYVYLVDFGAVQTQAIADGATFTVAGTYGYAPLEQFGGRACPASDLYALGATLIHLVTGTSPAELPQHNLQIQFSALVSLSPSLTYWLEQITQPAVEKRFASAREALQALQAKLVLVEDDPTPTNNSGQGDPMDESIPVPAEILGWNWGAFLLPMFWPLSNRAWIGLLAWIPLVGFVMAILMGWQGNKWAWRSRKWRSIEHFKAHQRGWAIAGIFLGGPTWFPTIIMVSRFVSLSTPILFGLSTVMGSIGLIALLIYGYRRRQRRRSSARSPETDSY